MDGHAIYMHRYAKNNDFPIIFAVFTKALRTNRRTNQITDGQTDRPTNQLTNGPTDGWTCPLIEMQEPHPKNKVQRKFLIAPQLRPLSKSATANVKQNRYRLRKYAPNVVPK